MAILHGDILLDNSKIFARNGDLAHGDAIEQQVGAILNAHSGNFRRWPTLAANLDLDVAGPMNSREIAGKVQNSIFLDGWRGIRLNIENDLENISVTLSEVEKITDETSSLV